MKSNVIENDHPVLDMGKKGNSTDKSLKLHKQLIAAQTVIFMLTFAVLALAASTFYFAVMQKPQPYVLRVDQDNRVTYGGALDAKNIDINPYAPNEIVRYIENWRMVTGDNTMQKRAATRLYCMMIPGSAASERMNEYYQDPTNNPFVVNRNHTRTVAMRTILQETSNTWSVEFTETTRDHTGQIFGEDNKYKVRMVIKKGDPRNECRDTNPLGTYITDINWSNLL